jgi:hypothetical protein
MWPAFTFWQAPRATMCAMAKALTLIAAHPLPDLADLLRAGTVIGCALALILAGPAFPSVL